MTNRGRIVSESTPPVELDEKYLMEWYAFGMAAMERCLSNYAKFEEFLRSKELEDEAAA